jgi:hypothetical protein
MASDTTIRNTFGAIFGAMALWSLALPGGALAQNPFGGNTNIKIQSQKVTQLKWQSQKNFDYRMGLVAKQYDPKLNDIKVKIATLHNRWLTLTRRSKISVAELTTIRLIER